MHNTIYIQMMHSITELYTGKLYGFINQCHPDNSSRFRISSLLGPCAARRLPRNAHSPQTHNWHLCQVTTDHTCFRGTLQKASEEHCDYRVTSELDLRQPSEISADTEGQRLRRGGAPPELGGSRNRLSPVYQELRVHWASTMCPHIGQGKSKAHSLPS